MSCNIPEPSKEEQFKNNKCPKCNQGLLLLRTLYMKVCVDCKIEYEWHLKPGQPPLIQHQR